MHPEPPEPRHLVRVVDERPVGVDGRAAGLARGALRRLDRAADPEAEARVPGLDDAHPTPPPPYLAVARRISCAKTTGIDELLNQ